MLLYDVKMFQSTLNFLTSLVFAVFSTFGINTGTEQPRHDVVERLGSQIEIRRYVPRVAAETIVDTEKTDNPRGDAFRIVAGYIFGANKQRQKIDMTAPVEVQSASTKIAMTAPVEIDKSDRKLIMRFFMPSQYKMSELPEPNDPRVKLIELPAATVAVLQFSGSTNDAAVFEKTAELLKTLEGTKWKIAGTATALFYNPPWTIPFLRRNEVLVAVSQ